MLTPDRLSNDLFGFLGPEEGRGIVVPVTEVVVDMADELANGIERSTPNGFTSEDAEPSFDEVDPGSTFWSEVEVNAGMFLKPLPNRGRRVNGRVVEDDVQVPFAERTRDFLEELEEVGTGVSLTALPDDASAGHLQRGEQAHDAVPLVVVSLTSREPWAQRQQRLRSVQGLDLGLLIKAQDHGVVRRVQVHPDDVEDLLFGVGISAELESPDLVRLEVMCFPDAVDGAVGQAGSFLHFSRGPMGQALRRRLERQRHNAGDLPSSNALGSSSMRAFGKTLDSLICEPSPDSTDLYVGVAGQLGHLDTGSVLGEQEDGAGSATKSRRARSSSGDLPEFTTLGLIEDDRSCVVGHESPPWRGSYMAYINSHYDTEH